MKTRFTECVGCEHPIQLAGMPGIATPELAAAVTRAGGLGMIGCVRSSPERLATVLEDLRAVAHGPVGVNFLIPFVDPACVDVAAAGAPVVEFFYGEPDPAWIERARRSQARVGWQIGSLREARAAAAAGCDYLIVQGTEAGGHVRGRTKLLALLAEVRAALDLPLLAAGGIATARHVAAACAAGADGVRVGTRFVAAAESGAHPEYVAALLAARSGDTVLTEAFSVPWPDAPHRVLRSCVQRAAALTHDRAGEVISGERIFPIPRWCTIAPTRETRGEIAAMALYAGESVGEVQRIEPAADIVHELAAAMGPSSS
jgi:NAD(P)H-dependent flavin oxidoreductase YrpB (nitropropane dioxygenase family)